MTIKEQIKANFKQGGVVTKLLYINIAVFLVLLLIQVICRLSGIEKVYDLIFSNVAISANLHTLLHKPWTILTYMFVHTGFFHLLFNMVFLYWVGQLFLSVFNSRQLLGVYVLGGLAGAVLYIIIYNLGPNNIYMPIDSLMLGASASIMAIMFTIVGYNPNLKINLMLIGQVKLWHLALGVLALDLISIAQSDNMGGHISHIGGAAFGYFYARLLLKGKDITLPFNRFMDKLVNIFKPSSKIKVSYKNPQHMTDMEYNASKRKAQHEIDIILEKIKASGYDSLTASEKKTLFDSSK